MARGKPRGYYGPPMHTLRYVSAMYIQAEVSGVRLKAPAMYLAEHSIHI